MKQNLFNFSPISNDFSTFSSNINSSFIINNMNNNINHLRPKKRNYNEFLESYKQSHNSSYLSEAESLHKSFNLRLRKNLENTINPFFKEEGKNYIKNQKKVANNNFPLNSHQKKIINLDNKKKFVNEEDDDIELIEKDFSVCDKRYGLSKSYLFDDSSGFYSDLDDTKENSFFSLNVSFDFPELNLDTNIKNKLISNAIELEKTFNRIFNVKNMPNKK